MSAEIIHLRGIWLLQNCNVTYHKEQCHLPLGIYSLWTELIRALSNHVLSKRNVRL